MATPQDDNKPVKMPSFLAHLTSTTESACPAVKALVSKMIETQSFAKTLGYYEIRGEPMLRALVEDIVQAVDKKMAGDFGAHQMGATTFQHAMYQAIGFALIAGAALAKDKQV
jgi:hypothetical protein